MTIDEFHGSAQVDLAAPADEVFALLVDVARLPEWNAHVHHVLEDPGRPLREGVEWVVQMRDMGAHWASRSRATAVDAATGRFEHTSRTDDDNPSYAIWSWQVTPTAAGCNLRVTWTGHPRSWWRRHLFAGIRSPRLEREVYASLAGLPDYLSAHPHPASA
jgi:hypothetical protein